MASESTAPPPAGNANLKYGAIGVGLIVAAAAVWFGMQSCEEQPVGPVTEAAPDAGSTERPTALVEEDLFIPELEPDAGPQIDAGPRIIYRTRYVGGGGGAWDNCGGEIDRAAASRVLAESNLQFRNCYERQLKVNNTLEGSINLQMKVGRDGRVEGVRTGGSLRNPQVLSCIRGLAQRVRFPSPNGGCAVVAVPLNFTPRR